jgi:GTP cyclohydrolase I
MLQQLFPLKGDVAPTPLADCQSQQDERLLRINRVGIKGLRYPIQFSNKSSQIQSTIATISLTVDLPAHVKGTHMSRFVEVLNKDGRVIEGQNLTRLVRQLRDRLDAGSAEIEIDFPYFIEKAAPISGQKALVDYNVKLNAIACGSKISHTVIVTVPVTTLCPCSKAISEYGAHNQRGYVTVTAHGEETIWVDDLIALIEASASSEIFALLKRPDEKHVTEQAYQNPVFVEDLVRNIALRLNTRTEIESYKVEAENMESIHNHSAYACIEKPVVSA